MFITEQELVDTLKLNYNNICNWNTARFQTNIMEEVNLGFGVADLVIYKVQTNTAANPPKASLNYFDLTIYKIIESGDQITIDKIREITKANQATIKKSINKLILESYVKKVDAIYNIRRNYKAVSNSSIAIEAKLKNWKRALNQAFRYKWFATYSYVVLDSNNISAAIKNIDSFRKFNVGLAEINQSGVLMIHFKPSKQKPIDEKMFMLLNEQIKQCLFSL